MWKEKDNKLVIEYTFSDFKEAFAFMKKAAELIDEHGHHPTWTNTYNKLQIELTTHDAGNKVTEKDVKLSQEISKLYEEFK